MRVSVVEKQTNHREGSPRSGPLFDRGIGIVTVCTFVLDRAVHSADLERAWLVGLGNSDTGVDSRLLVEVRAECLLVVPYLPSLLQVLNPVRLPGHDGLLSVADLGHRNTLLSGGDI